MKSIRLSLLAYFLLLLAVALGACSFLIYQIAREFLSGMSDSTHQTLSDNNARNVALHQERCELMRQTQNASFDDRLLVQAQRLGDRLARQTSNRRPLQNAIPVVGTVPVLPNGPVTIPLALYGGDACHSVAARRLLRPGSLDPRFLEAERQPRDEQNPEYFQVYNDLGDPLLSSPSLGEDRLTLDEDALHLPVFDHDMANVTLASGKKVRQVTLRAGRPLDLYLYGPSTGRWLPERWFPRRWFPRRWFSEPWNPAASPASWGWAQRGCPSPTVRRTVVIPVNPDALANADVPIVFIQYARPTTEIDDVLASLQANLDQTKARLDQELTGTLQEQERQSQASLAFLRAGFLLIGLATFVATTIGGIWLVHRGLAPIQRITDAVSRVSERDFHLHLAKDEVPTELGAIVERFQQALGLLERAFAREKQAAADISHELRTPISALLATAEVTLKKSRSPDEYRAALESCREIGRQLTGLVERLLTLTRLDAGADTLKPELVNVPHLVEQCLSLVRPLAETRGLTLKLDRNGPVVLETDAEKLREVLTNLLHNAIQYNRPEGSVEVVLDRHNGDLSLEVRDTGVGIPAAAREHLFERFYRVDPSRQSDTIHAGLGLAIVKGYLDLMGGRIEVDSTEGQGSTFRVLLPMPPEESV